MKNILITGGSGFIGRNLVEKISGDVRIYSPSHKELDILDYERLSKYILDNHIDVIVHGAVHVPMFNGTEKEFFNDMQMFLNLEKISGNIEKIIYFGSGAEYDKRYDIRMVSEESFGKTIPITEYGLAKYTMTKIARRSENIYNLRLFGVFGRYELWQIKFISNLCCKAVFDLPLSVRKDCFFDFLYIDDLVNIVNWFIWNKPIHHDYNTCHGKPYSLLQLAQIVNEISGKGLDINLLSDERNLDYTASNQRLINEIVNVSITPMENAIQLLYDYYKRNKNLIDFSILKESK